MTDFVRSAGPASLALAVTAFFVGLTGISLLVGFGLERLLRHRRIWAVPLDAGQLGHELIGNLAFLAVTILSFTAALAGRMLRLGDDTPLRMLLTFLCLGLGFQVFYYGLHRALHTRSLVRFHRFHHASRVTTPLSGQSMHVVEAAGWMLGYVGLPILFSQVAPISLVGWAAYMTYNVLGNIVGHANVESVPAAPGVRTLSLFSNVLTYHALHHARWTGHYGFATALMDRLFGTEWDDWQALHRRTASGDPLPHLRFRIADDERCGG
jgi:sterol desaturase/sphingolipid hydroxylase (fatty acid hydroxylase superfamily)